MKTITKPVNLWEKGDRVLTPCGEGTIWEDQTYNYPENPVEVLLDEECSEYPNGHKYPVTFDDPSILREL